MSDLDRAIARSFSPGHTRLRAESPMAPLGRRRMGATELVAQSVATTAPAASMAMLPLVVGRLADPLSGLLVIVGATVAVTMVALCLGQFTDARPPRAVSTASSTRGSVPGPRSRPPS
ncbi:hypothetical protein [Pseudonocardia sp. HH130629-09]|uniref:hypothetical protein n=1 Tax=Pseudonocardia sp. HH130629-09 TaxID=1641402 RepID=UPI00076164E3|nr:hypothetical protein [Pseudonocardia sp. HH130629-09]